MKKQYLKKIGNRAKSLSTKLVRPLYLNLNSDYKNTIFLSGTERSGSTWVSDLINYNNEYRYIFEPFWPLKVPECKGLNAHQYIRPENRDVRSLRTTREILSGKIRNKWTDQYHRKYFASKRLIKDIRTNLFLKWMKNNFPEIPIVFLMRHPCAVARSFFRRERTYSFLKPFVDQVNLVDDYLNPFMKKIDQVSTDLEAIIFSWCIQNYVPLSQFKRKEIYVLFYERLCEYPEEETKRLFSFIGIKYENKVLEKIKRPSPQSFQESAIYTGGSLIDSWREYFSNDDIEKCVGILELFGLDRIYSNDSMPNVDGLLKIFEENERRLS
jgi:hypothetical protein